MRKLYIFGDSFSMMPAGLLDGISDKVENNAHYSISNEHILKLAKIKLLKLLKNNESSNILIQLTISGRLLLNYNDKFKYLISNIENLKYNNNILHYADKELFEQNRYVTLYPFFGSFQDPLIKNLFVPYYEYAIENNSLNYIRDLVLELNVLQQLASTNNINLEYFFYTNDYDSLLNEYNDENKILNSFHIKFDNYHSMESYLRYNNKPEYFVSLVDKHFNDEGKKWYIKWLRERYDF